MNNICIQCKHVNAVKMLGEVKLSACGHITPQLSSTTLNEVKITATFNSDARPDCLITIAKHYRNPWKQHHVVLDGVW